MDEGDKLDGSSCTTIPSHHIKGENSSPLEVHKGVLDEGHEMSDLVVNTSNITINVKTSTK